MLLDNRKKLSKFILIAAIVITLAGFFYDLHNTINYPGTDLRNRVVGARLALDGIDPYFFKWHSGLSERLFDPMDNPAHVLSKLSVPPTVIALHSPIAHLDYLQQKLIWLFFQWSAFATIIAIFFTTNQDSSRRKLILFVAFIFANSLFWRFHVNSGQIYVVYIALLSVSWLLLNKKFKHHEIASGFLAGITAALRPPYILFFPLFLIQRRYSFIVGGIAGAAVAILSSVAITGTFIWQRYILAMLGMTGFVNLQEAARQSNAVSAAATVYPHIVEGVNFKIRNPLEAKLLSNSSLYEILNALDVSNKKEILVCSFAIAAAICLWLGIKYFGKKKVDANVIFLSSTLICLISEFFIPIARYSYYDIQWLLPLLVIVSYVNLEKMLNSKLVWVLGAGSLLTVVHFSWINNSLFYSTYLIAAYAVFTTVLLLGKPQSREA